MQEYGFSLTGIFPYKNRIYDSDLIRENMGPWKPLFSYILCSVISSNCLLWVPPIFTRYAVHLKMDAYWWTPIAIKRLCEKLVRHLTISPLLRPYCSVLPNSWWKHLFEALDVVPEVVNFSHPIFSDFLSTKEVLFWLSCLSPPVLGKIFSNLMLTLQLL